MTTDLVPARDSVIVPLDTGQVSAAMARYQDGLKSILDDGDWQTFATRKGGPGRFLKKSGWRKIAFWFSLDLQLLDEQIERDPAGNPLRARVIARATHPNGRYADGDGRCSSREGGFNKPENDIPGTAATRAINRAISNLVGMGDVSAEEIEGIETPQHPYGEPAPRQVEAAVHRAIEVIYNTDDAIDIANIVARLETDAGGYLPRIVARAVMLLAAHRPGRNATAGTGTEGTPQDDTPTGANTPKQEPTP